MTVKVWLHVRPAPGAQVSAVEALIPSDCFATHGRESGSAGGVAELFYQLVGEDREQVGQSLVDELSSSPLVSEAFLRRMRVGVKQRVRK